MEGKKGNESGVNGMMAGRVKLENEDGSEAWQNLDPPL